MNYIAERRQEEKEARRNQIVDAAEEALKSAEWETLTIDQVARRARLSRALVYVYFKDKFDLHCAIAERALQLLADRFAQAAERPARGVDKVEALGRAYVAFAHEFPHYFAALARFETHEVTHVEHESNEAACMVAGERVHAIMVRCIEEGIADGSVRSDLGNPYLTSVTLWGFMHGIIQISQTKANMLASDGISTQQLISHALKMAMLGMAPKESGG